MSLLGGCCGFFGLWVNVMVCLGGYCRVVGWMLWVGLVGVGVDWVDIMRWLDGSCGLFGWMLWVGWVDIVGCFCRCY